MNQILCCVAACLILSVQEIMSASSPSNWPVRAIPIILPPPETMEKGWFADVTGASGLSEPLRGMMGHGGAWGDFDGDGLIDLFVGAFSDRPNTEYAPAPGPVPNQLFRNLGQGRFASVRQFQTYARTSGAVFADLDNNGTLELYVGNNAKPGEHEGRNEPQQSALKQHCQLFRNDGGKFVDISRSSGTCPDTLFTVRNVGVLDYNADGLLDLFVVEDRFTSRPRSVLFKNLGGLRFQDVNKEAGLSDDIYGLGLAVADVNEDSKPDLFVPHSNRFFLSQPGDRYIEPPELRTFFAWEPLSGEDWPCGAAFGDLNRDGRLDLVLTLHYKTARNRVYLNEGLVNGVPRFRNITEQAGLGTPVPVRCPHVEIQDLNNDGWPDIYISATRLKDGEAGPLIFRHGGLVNGLPRFTPTFPVTEANAYFPAGPSGDFDNDGRVDLFLVNWFSDNHCRLLRNISEGGRWLNVSVTGRTLNRMGIGAEVRIFKPWQGGRVEGLLGFQEIATGYGYASGQSAMAHFGLGQATSVDLEVKFPNGKRVKRTGVQANQSLHIQEP